jgi:hypothetical protein
MKTTPRCALAAFSAALLLSLGQARADDASTPPAPPAQPAPDAGPSDANPPPAPPANGDQPRPNGRGRRPGYDLAELTQKLGLTADQQKTVGGIIANARSQGRALFEDDSLSREDRHAKMKQINETTRAGIRAALTPDQQKIFDALPRPREGHRPPPDAPPAPPPSDN